MVAIAETVTWSLLIAGMIGKYVLQLGDLGVSIGGFLHGLVFLAYGMTAVLVGVNQRWRPRLMLLAVGTAVIPYATIPVDRWLDRRGRLDGPWHTGSTRVAPGSRAARLLERMLRHPLALGITFVIALATIMTALLTLGPPGK